MTQQKSLGPFIRGMNQVSNETSMPRERGQTLCCRSAQNIDFDRDGNYSRREGFVKLYSGTNFHSIYPSKAHHAIFTCQKNNIGTYDPVANAFSIKTTMPKAYKTAFAELNGTTYAFNPAFNCRFPPDSTDAFTLSVASPNVTPAWSVSTAGGLEVGDYIVAYSILNSDKEESPLFGETQVSVAQGGGIMLVGVPIESSRFIRIYASTANGEELYQMIEAPMSIISFTIGAAEIKAGGQQPQTRFLEELPFGHFVEVFRSRLLVASDNRVSWSEAFRPHLTDPRHNFVQMESTITMMKPVNGGIYISDGKSVRFLDNEDPDKFIVRDIDAEPAFYGSATVVPGAAIGEEEVDHAIIWLSTHGHIAGLPGGRIQRLNADQLNLPKYTVTSGVYTERKGLKQVIIPVNSERREGTGTAVDSSI